MSLIGINYGRTTDPATPPFADISNIIANVMAGGGSLVSLPLLLFLGLDSGMANGTNRLSIAIQNITAVAAFRKNGVGSHRLSLMLAIPALPGAVAGAITSMTISDLMFRRLLAGIMIVVLVLTAFRHRRPSPGTGTEDSLTAKQKILTSLCFIGIGFYAGYIQAGIGIIVIGLMSLTTHLDLVRINFYKVWVIGLCTWVAMIVFAGYNQVHWPIACILALGNAVGGWLGGHASIAGGEKWILRVFTVVVIAMAIKLLGFC